VFDHIQAGRILEQPAGKDAPELIFAAAIGHQHLNEGAGFLRRFPRSGPLARAQSHDHIAHAARIARRHFQLLRNVVTLVEETDRRHPLFERRAQFGGVAGDFGWRRRVVSDAFGDFGADRFRLGRVLAASAQADREQ